MNKSFGLLNISYCHLLTYLHQFLPLKPEGESLL